MQKDVRIGMIVGGVIALLVVIWFAIRPSDVPRTAPAADPAQQAPGPQAANPGAWPANPVQGQPNSAPGVAQTPPAQPAYGPQSEFAAGQGLAPQIQPGAPYQVPAQPVTLQPAQPVQAVQTPAPTKRVHVVQKGETLSDISEVYYKTANQWKKIQQANRSQIPDPDHIRPGMKLVIPD